MSKQKSSGLGVIVLGAALAINACDYESNSPNNTTNRRGVVSSAQQNLNQTYSYFRFPNELETIAYHANRVGVDLPLLLAIREAENGRNGVQFGIMHMGKYNNDSGFAHNNNFYSYPNDNELSKQTSWAAWTIRKNYERFNSLSSKERSKYADFIDFLGNRYAPIKADNDPGNLNSNWKRNVRNRYNIHKL